MKNIVIIATGGTIAGSGKMGKATNYQAGKINIDEIIDSIPMINEVIRCLDEGIIASPAEADIALVYGLGFPPFRGGVFRYLDTIGLAQFVANAEQYSELGPLYQIPESLKQKALRNEIYYPKPAKVDVNIRELA